MTGMQKLLGVELTDELMTGTSFTMQEGRLILSAMNARKYLNKANTEIQNFSKSKIQDILAVRPNLAKIATSLVMRGKDVYGVDVDQERLKYALEKANWNPDKKNRFYAMDTDPRQIGGLENNIDAAYCASGLTHLGASPAIVFGEVYKTLVSGGVIAVTGCNGKHAEYIGKKIEWEINKAKKVVKDGVELCLSSFDRKEIEKAKLNFTHFMPSKNDSPDAARQALQTAGFLILDEKGFYPIKPNKEEKPLSGGYFILAKKA